MTRVCTKLFVGALVAVIVSACQVDKSANPLSPAVAGPIAGVVISTPNLLEPGQDWTLRSRDQPVKLMFQNAEYERRSSAEILVRRRNRFRLQEHRLRSYGCRTRRRRRDPFPVARQAGGRHLLVADEGGGRRQHRSLLSHEELSGPRRGRPGATDTIVSVERLDRFGSDANVQGEGR